MMMCTGHKSRLHSLIGCRLELRPLIVCILACAMVTEPSVQGVKDCTVALGIQGLGRCIGEGQCVEGPQVRSNHRHGL